MGRWQALALLFGVRTAMAFQFQSVASLGPQLEAAYGLTLADLGFLFGLYMAPGIVVALAGGRLGQAFGDARVVMGGLVLMTLGGAMMAMSPDTWMMTAGRLISGAGGVLLNVVMTKMISDRFDGREIATAMAIFVNSWPVGIALALIFLPGFGAWAGVEAALWLSAGLSVPGLLAMLLIWRDRDTGGAESASGARLSGRPFVGAVAAGWVWGFFNGALAIAFGFGTALLVERGAAIEVAGWPPSLVMIATAIVAPFGGMLSDRTGRRDLIIAVGGVAMAVFLILVAMDIATTLSFIGIGCATGLIAGPIMALPASVLPPAMRAAGMGVFFSVYYASILITPVLAGVISEAADTAAWAFSAAALFAILAIGGLNWTRRSALEQMG